MSERFYDVDGALWEATGMHTLRCLVDPSFPEDTFPGVEMPFREVNEVYGPLIPLPGR